LQWGALHQSKGQKPFSGSMGEDFFKSTKYFKLYDLHIQTRSQNNNSSFVQNTILSQMVPDAAIFTVLEVFPDEEPSFSTAWTTSYPSTTSPKTTCFPSNQEVVTVVMKNWEPLVCAPALAMERRPGLVCLRWKFSSSNRSP